MPKIKGAMRVSPSKILVEQITRPTTLLPLGVTYARTILCQNAANEHLNVPDIAVFVVVGAYVDPLLEG